jgi:hypothetical protein
MQVSHSGVHGLAPAHHRRRRTIVHGLLGSRAVCLGVVHEMLGQLLEMRLVVGRVVGRGRRLVCGRRLEASAGARAIRRPVHDDDGLRAPGLKGSRLKSEAADWAQGTDKPADTAKTQAIQRQGMAVIRQEIGEVRGYNCRTGKVGGRVP